MHPRRTLLCQDIQQAVCTKEQDQRAPESQAEPQQIHECGSRHTFSSPSGSSKDTPTALASLHHATFLLVSSPHTVASLMLGPIEPRVSLLDQLFGPVSVAGCDRHTDTHGDLESGVVKGELPHVRSN